MERLWDDVHKFVTTHDRFQVRLPWPLMRDDIKPSLWTTVPVRMSVKWTVINSLLSFTAQVCRLHFLFALFFSGIMFKMAFLPYFVSIPFLNYSKFCIIILKNLLKIAGMDLFIISFYAKCYEIVWICFDLINRKW